MVPHIPRNRRFIGLQSVQVGCADILWQYHRAQFTLGYLSAYPGQKTPVISIRSRCLARCSQLAINTYLRFGPKAR